ncbi:hypothetical protein O7635_01660 [Asanoa sp. WMMD1127]|uniref:hypothetical protein n=1 Tax=Asanoa sp. WMMD1127 TaxID=3016107 RepID=UPI002416E52C|nr:hypothetical protein [Asanoa sp. WMMD1127]MDG4820558.1 hypothetical protein [Asanoa sp. WMMD1127]
MRVVRTVAGLVLLTIGLPVLLVGGALWTLMQHRDADGAFSGSLQQINTSGRAIVVPDVDALLREDAPFVRAGDTRLRLTTPGATFLGLAPASEVRGYLAGAAYSQVDAVSVARGDLPVRVAPVAVAPFGADGLAGPAASGVTPGSQTFWTRQGSGSLEWTANEVDGREMSLVVMRVDGTAGMTVTARASASPGWLVPTTWSLVVLGVLLVGGGIAGLLWPARPREVVFVVDPSQVPQVSARLGGLAAPVGPPPVWPALPSAEVASPVPVLPGEPVTPADGGWPDWPSETAPSGRPATLADALAGAGMPATPPPGPAWPPAQPVYSTDADAPAAWRRAEAARLAGLPAVVAAQLSVEAAPTSGAPAGAASTAPVVRSEGESRPSAEDGDTRTPAQRSAGAKVAHLRAVKTDEVSAKRSAGAKKRPVVFVDTATEPTGESPDRPVVAIRGRTTRTTKTAPQPRDAAGAMTAAAADPAVPEDAAVAAGPPDGAATEVAPGAAVDAADGATARSASDAAAGSAVDAGVAETDAAAGVKAELASDATAEPAPVVGDAAAGGGVTTAGAGTETAGAEAAAESVAGEAGSLVSGTAVVGPAPTAAVDSDVNGTQVAKPTRRKSRAAADGEAGAAKPAKATTRAARSKASVGEAAASSGTRTRKPRQAAAAVEPTESGTEVIESTGSGVDVTAAEHAPASAGVPVGTGAIVASAGEASAAETKAPARRATRAKKAATAESETKPAKVTRAPRRKATAASDDMAAATKAPGATADGVTASRETAVSEGEPTGSGTVPGGAGSEPAAGNGLLGAMAPPAKARRRKTAAGLPAPEATDVGPATNAVSAQAAKRPTTRRRPTKAAPPATRQDLANPTDQAS